MLLFASVSVIAAVVGGDYNTSHMRLVDHDATSGNWLFRGSIPIIRNDSSGDSYAYDQLAKVFHDLAAESKLQFPAEYHMVDVSLLTSEKDDISLIEKFFAAKPALGEMWKWPVGTLLHGIKTLTFRARSEGPVFASRAR